MHIEVIVRQMPQKVEIMDPGDTTFLTGETADRTEFDPINSKLLKGERPAHAMPAVFYLPRLSLGKTAYRHGRSQMSEPGRAHTGRVEWLRVISLPITTFPNHLLNDKLAGWPLHPRSPTPRPIHPSRN